MWRDHCHCRHLRATTQCRTSSVEKTQALGISRWRLTDVVSAVWQKVRPSASLWWWVACELCSAVLWKIRNFVDHLGIAQLFSWISITVHEVLLSENVYQSICATPYGRLL